MIAFIADQVTQNVRAMEGALTRLIAYAALKSRPVSLDLAREALPLKAAATPSADAELVARRVAAEWGVTPEALASKRRTKEIVEPRQVAMHLCREILGMTLSDIRGRIRRTRPLDRDSRAREGARGNGVQPGIFCPCSASRRGAPVAGTYVSASALGCRACDQSAVLNVTQDRPLLRLWHPQPACRYPHTGHSANHGCDVS